MIIDGATRFRRRRRQLPRSITTTAASAITGLHTTTSISRLPHAAAHARKMYRALDAGLPFLPAVHGNRGRNSLPAM